VVRRAGRNRERNQLRKVLQPVNHFELSESFG
jgi:hypothetical protein